MIVYGEGLHAHGANWRDPRRVAFANFPWSTGINIPIQTQIHEKIQIQIHIQTHHKGHNPL